MGCCVKGQCVSMWICENIILSAYAGECVNRRVCVCVVWDQWGSAEEEKLKARAIYQEHSIFSWFMRQNTGKYTAHILWVTVSRTVITTQIHKLRKLLWEFFFFFWIIKFWKFEVAINVIEWVITFLLFARPYTTIKAINTHYFCVLHTVNAHLMEKRIIFFHVRFIHLQVISQLKTYSCSLTENNE